MTGAAGGRGQSDTGFERHKKAKEIFGEAVDLAAADRERCLDAACGGDAALRSEVEELIEADRAWSPGLLPGTRVGEYRILRQIGVGGMGAVYEAEQDAPRRSVALKLLRPEMADAEGRRRFAREGEVLGRLRHPGIAQVYSLAETPVGPAIVMEYVDGVPLDRFAGDLPIPRRVALVAAIGDAVEEAHRHGVIHRDLKPGNVLVTRDGQPKVLDFGLARSLDGAQDSMQTRVGRVMGTLAYMSPEQASGARDRVDTRTDVYSLGVMAFQLLTGRLPHDIEGRSLPGVLRVLQESDAPAAATIDRRLRGDLTVILAKALARDPARRYQGVREFTEDLRRHLRREPILARPVSALQRLNRFVRRNTAAVAAVAGVFLALGVGILLSIRFARDSARKADRAHLQAADAAFHLRQRHIAREHLDAVRAGSRDWEWRYLDNQLDRALRFVPRGPGEHPWALATRMFAYPITCDGGGSLTLSANGVALPRIEGRLKSMSVSPDRRRVLVVLHGEVLVLDAASGETVLRFRSVRSLHKAAASPDGRIIAVVGTAPGIALHDAQTGRLLRFVDAHRDEVYSVAFDPSGRRIATGSRDARVEIREVETGKLLHALTESRLTAYDLAFSPDGSRIAAGAGDHSIYVWNVETGDLRSTLLGHDGAVVAVQFTGGDRLRSVGEDGYREWLVDFPDPRDHARHDTPPFPYVYDVRVSRDGRRIATIGWDRQLLLHDAESGEVLWTARTESIAEAAAFGADADSVVVFERRRISEWRGGERIAHVPSSRYGYDLDTSPDGRTLCGAGESNKVLRWRLPGLEPLPGFVLPDRAGPRAVAWSPDGRAIAVGDQAGRCHLLDASDGSVLWTARCADAAVWSLALSPDGHQLAAGLATGEVRILDARTGAGRAMLSGHQGAVYALSFLPDGSRLASGAHDKSIRLWDPRAATSTLTLDGHDWYVKGLAFALDGRVLVSGSGDGTVRWWSAERRRPER